MALLGGFGGGLVGGATVRLLLDDTQFKRGLAEAKGETQAASTTMGKFGGAAKAAFAVGGIAAIAFGVAGVKALEGFQQAQAQTEAVLKSTGGAANVTAAQVEAYARQLGATTGVQDDAIQGAENMILTFRNIRNEAGAGNDIFNQTTKAVLDMATAMNGGAIPSAEELRVTSIRLGKALNDPTVGLTALRRVGVTFSDAQSDVIKKLYDTGHALEAQKLVLKEINKEFGGSAKAAGDTMAGAMGKLDNALRPVLISIGQGLLPIIKDLAGALRAVQPILKLMANNLDLTALAVAVVIQRLSVAGVGISAFTAKLGLLAAAFFTVTEAQKLWTTIQDTNAAKARTASNEIDIQTHNLINQELATNHLTQTQKNNTKVLAQTNETENMTAVQEHLDLAVKSGTLSFGQYKDLIAATGLRLNVTAGSLQDAAKKTAALSGVLGPAAAKTALLAQQHRAAAAGAKAQAAADADLITKEQELAGGFLGVTAAERDLASKQATLNSLRAHGKTGTA